MDDEKVERSLLMLATGYEKDLPIYDPEGNLIEMRKVHVPPNAAAIQFYLKNRRSEKWRDKIDIAASMEQIPVRINFKRKEKVIDAEASIIPERKEIDGTQQRHTDIHEERESDVDIEE